MLLDGGFSSTAPLNFTVVFEHPTAEIQPVAQPVVEFDPVREFTDPLFVFVNKPKELPLEVVLAEDSTPLDGSGAILRDLALTLTLTTAGEITATVSIIAGDAESGSPGAPGRSLLFEVAAVKNNVNVEVYVADADQDPKVTVAPFRFKTHFLSLAHEDEIQFSDVGNSDDFAPDTEVITVSLAGEDPAGERWTLSVANSGRLEGNGYSVEEVIFVPRITQVNEIVKKTVDGATKTFELGTETLLNGEVIKPVVFVEVDTRTLSVDVWDFLSASDITVQTKTLGATTEREVYRPLTAAEMGEDRATRSLRIARLRADAEDSRVLLRFDYRLVDDAESEGFFYRTVAIDTGLAAELRVNVTPDSVVVAKGGTGEVTLVVSNLQPDDDPAGSIRFKRDNADLSIVLLEDGILDPINRRFEQRLQVAVDEDAGKPFYDVVVVVRLRGKDFTTEFRVDVNDPPRYDGDRRLLRVYESDTGDQTKPRTKTFVLRIVDADGGRNLLDPAELMLEVVGFGEDLNLKDPQDYENDYFELNTTATRRHQENGDDSVSYQRNSLAVTLTLTGKLAMPYGSVVELRLSGVDDGYGDPEDIVGRLFVSVEDVAPSFELLITNTVALLDQEVRIGFETFSDGSSSDDPNAVPTVLVVEAPDDLLVRYDEVAREVTLLRLERGARGADRGCEVGGARQLGWTDGAHHHR